MFSALPRLLNGALTVLLYGLSTLFWGLPVYGFALVKLVIPEPRARAWCRRALTWLGDSWVGTNRWMSAFLQGPIWDVQLPPLRRDGHYLVLSNHRSWVDIFALFLVLHRRTAWPRFLLKDSLKWAPIIGQACWAMDFPFMKRHSREFLHKHPERRGDDLEATRRSCSVLKGQPLTIINYVEGTRFSEAKRIKQSSPYQHLLRPAPGSAAVIMQHLGAELDTILDATLFYPQGPVGVWDLFCGRVKRIVVRIEELPVPPELVGRDFREETEFKVAFKAWLNDLWQAKERKLGELERVYQDPSAPPPTSLRRALDP